MVLPESERDYTRYLDKDFLKAYEIVECRSGAISINFVLSKISLAVMLSPAMISSSFLWHY